MARMSWQTILGLITAAFLFGCADETTTDSLPPVDQLHQGLNLLDTSDPAWGVSAAFVVDDAVVYMQTRVGPEKPLIYQQTWPGDPPNEMDVRFVDQDGIMFYAVRGGDEYIDQSWAADLDRAMRTHADHEARELDFRLAKAGADEFVATAGPELADHSFHLAQFATADAPADDLAMQQKMERIQSSPLPADVAYGNFTYGGYSWYETDLYSGDTGCLCFGGCCLAKHSATLMWDAEWNTSTNSYTWVLAQNACNHGRCYNGSGMGYNCYSNGGWFYWTTINGETNSNNTSISGGCRTPYDWDSGGYDHLCNDDAAYELWQAKSGSLSTAYGDGYSFKWFNGSSSKGNSYFACNCSSFNGCDNDWGRPSCP